MKKFVIRNSESKVPSSQWHNKWDFETTDIKIGFKNIQNEI